MLLLYRNKNKKQGNALEKAIKLCGFLYSACLFVLIMLTRILGEFGFYTLEVRSPGALRKGAVSLGFRLCKLPDKQEISLSA